MKILRNTSFGILGFLLLLAIFIEIKDGYLLLFFGLGALFQSIVLTKDPEIRVNKTSNYIILIISVIIILLAILSF